MLTILLFVLFILFMCLGIPVAVAIGLATCIAFVAGGYDLLSVPQQMANSTKTVSLLAVPFFILAGNMMNALGITQKIFDFASCVVGSIKGGLAQVNVLASMIFAGISGAALADAAGLGTIEIKAMKRAGYDEAFSAAVTVCSATIGPIIPPSIMMVIYAIMANVSIAEMFLAGVLPGIMIGVFLMVFIYFRGSERPTGLSPAARVVLSPAGGELPGRAPRPAGAGHHHLGHGGRRRDPERGRNPRRLLFACPGLRLPHHLRREAGCRRPGKRHRHRADHVHHRDLHRHELADHHRGHPDDPGGVAGGASPTASS